MKWVMVTGAYPPQQGGVSDYSRLVAQGLAAAGDEVHVWTSACSSPTSDEGGVIVHRLPGHFGLRALARLHAGLSRLSKPYRILVQYVPHAFGWKAMNLPLCLWLLSRRRDEISTMFHEVAFPLRRRQPVSHNVLAVVTRLMAALVVRASQRIFVAIPAWEHTLRELGAKHPNIVWLPVPSNVATRAPLDTSSPTRARMGLTTEAMVLGHFGTYPESIASLLEPALATLLRADDRRLALLLGRGAGRFAKAFLERHPDLAGRLRAPGGMPQEDIAAYLAACDMLIQPYPDGVSSRRGSVMAGLALGLPIVTTEGPLTEPIWRETRAVELVPVNSVSQLTSAVESVLLDGSSRESLGLRAAQLYAERFALEHTLRALRA